MSSVLGGFAGLGGGSIGRAAVDLVLDSSSYQAGLAETEAKTKASTASMGKGFSGFQQQIKSSFSGAQLAMVGFGAVAAVAITKAVGVTTDWAAQVRSLQRVTGQSAESASALAGAASILGLDVTKLTTGFGLLEKNIVNASANLTKYGIATKDASGNILPFDDVLQAVSEKFATLQAGPEQAAFAMNVFGRSGKDLIPILQQGSAGLADLEQKAKDAGLVMSQDTLDSAKNLTRAQHELADAFKGAAVQLGTSFLPVMTSAAHILTSLVEIVGHIPQPVLAIGTAFVAITATLLVAVKVFNALKVAMVANAAEMVTFGLYAAPVVLILAAIAIHAQSVADHMTVMNASVTSAVSSLSGGVDALKGLELGLGTVGNSLVGFAVLFDHAVQVGEEAGQTFQDVATIADQQLTQAFSNGEISAGKFKAALEYTGMSAKDAEQAVISTAAASDTLTHHFDEAGNAVKNFADFTGKALTDWQTSVTGNIEQTFGTLGTKTKDIFDTTSKQLSHEFAAMLAQTARFQGDMAQLLSLKAGSFGISRADVQAFEAFLGNTAPGKIDAFVNSSHAAQERDIKEWLRHQAIIDQTTTKVEHLSNAINALPTSHHLDITISTAIDSGNQQIAAAVARYLATQGG